MAFTSVEELEITFTVTDTEVVIRSKPQYVKIGAGVINIQFKGIVNV